MKFQKLYTVSEAAQAAHVGSAQTLRRMDRIVQPIKTEAGQRLYTDQHIAIAKAVTESKKTSQ